MRLLLTTDTVGGVWTYAIDLCRALQPHGVQIALATMGAPMAADQRRDVALLPHVRVAESTFKLEWMRDPWEDVRASGQWLLELEQAFRPDVVHLNGYAHGSLPFRAPVVVVGHSCVCSWWQAVKRERAPREWDRYRQEVTTGLQQADLIVAPSQAMLSALQSHYGPLPRTRVIHNGRSDALYSPGRKSNLILSAGRLWDEAKNLAALQRVASNLPWSVCVAGDDRSPDGGRRDTAGVRCLGRLDADALACWYAKAAIYALPARYEPFGLSALEAGLSGCALVLGGIDSLREVWDDAAAYVDPDDAGALRSTLVDLIEHPDRRESLRRLSLTRARRYAPQHMAGAYLAAYRDVARRAAAVEQVLPAHNSAAPAAFSMEG